MKNMGFLNQESLKNQHSPRNKSLKHSYLEKTSRTQTLKQSSIVRSEENDEADQDSLGNEPQIVEEKLVSRPKI